MRKRGLRLLLTAIIVFIAGTSVYVWWALRSTPYIRDRVVEALNERFASQVSLDALDMSVLPRPRAAGSGLHLRHNGRTDVPPLISIDSFESTADLRGLVKQPVHLKTVELQGLDIRIPPGGLNPGADRNDHARELHVPHEQKASPILIDKIHSRSARLEVASSRPGRLPRVWEIHDLLMHNFGALNGSQFEAGLVNAIPRGRVESSGVFGPWHADEPGLTPVQGEYVFRNANLDDIRGLGGTLSSTGMYRGVLERLEVEGQTETPDFSLDIAGAKVPLKTVFKAIVDGTNGDTILERVEARLNNSTIIAHGSVVRTEDVKGRRVAMDVRLDGARLEDLMLLAVKSNKPPLIGRVDLTSRFVLPAGEADVIDRLELEATFRLVQARFTNVNVQRRITTLSRRGRGDETDEGAEHERIVSNLQGRFVMRRANLSFSELTFGVPGSIVQLSGTYDLHSETMNFTGELLTDATLADMTSGFKSVLARIAQPLFRRPGGGSRLPIRISGTRSKPEFGLDVRRVFHRS